MNQKVMQNNLKKEHKVDQRSKNISMKQNNGSLKKLENFKLIIKEIDRNRLL